MAVHGRWGFDAPSGRRCGGKIRIIEEQTATGVEGHFVVVYHREMRHLAYFFGPVGISGTEPLKRGGIVAFCHKIIRKRGIGLVFVAPAAVGGDV